MPGRFKVVRHVREAFSCRACESVVQAPAPHHAIARGRAGPGLLAHIVVAKFDDHLPLYRQAEIYAREGVQLETSTLSGWVGATAAALMPLVDASAAGRDRRLGGAARRRHACPGARAWHGQDQDRAPVDLRSRRAAVRWRSALRRPCSSPRRTARASGRWRIWRASRACCRPMAMPGFNGLYDTGRIVEAACWAHTRRKFFDVHAATGSTGGSRGAGTDRSTLRRRAGNPWQAARRATDEKRQASSMPIADALQTWAQSVLPQLSRRSELAAAFRYMLARWTALTRAFDDGRLALDNNPAERALRGVAIGRKNYLFAGSDRGAERAATLYSLDRDRKAQWGGPGSLPSRRDRTHR